jgi:subtilisin family serine protease
VLDAVEKAAIDYAIEQGVIIVASAGNAGEAGMGFPGAYAPVISVAASGWVGEWTTPLGNNTWWRTRDVADPTSADDFYITDFSSRQLDGQQLDVAAPGSWVVGPYQVNSGSTASYFFLGGTSMASPHVAGIAALLLAHHPLFQESLRARTPQRVAALFGMIRSLCVPYAFGGERIGGVPRLHGLAPVLRPSVDPQRPSHGGTAGNGREASAALREQLAAAAFQASAPQAGAFPTASLAAAVAGVSDPWTGGRGYAPAALGVQEWPYHALLETLRQRFGGWS